MVFCFIPGHFSSPHPSSPTSSSILILLLPSSSPPPYSSSFLILHPPPSIPHPSSSFLILHPPLQAAQCSMVPEQPLKDATLLRAAAYRFPPPSAYFTLVKLTFSKILCNSIAVRERHLQKRLVKFTFFLQMCKNTS